MRKLMLAVCLCLGATSALAYDARTAAQEWNDARGNCRMGETSDGQPLTKDEVAATCERRDVLTVELKANGMCFDQSEQEWAVCAK